MGAAEAAVAAASASCSFTRSQCPEPGARLGSLRSSRSCLGTRRAPAPGDRTAGLAGPSPGRAADAGRRLGGVHGDLKPRGTAGTLGRGVGSGPGGGGLAAPRLTFRPVPRLPRPGPGCGRRVWLGAGGGWPGRRERPQVWARRGAPRPAWRASSGRSQDAAVAAPPRAGEDPGVAVRVSGGGTPCPEPSRGCGTFSPHRVLPPSPGRGAGLRGRAQVPTEPKPSRRHARRGLTLPPLRILCPHSLQENPGPSAVLRVIPDDTPPTLGGESQNPKLKEKRVTPPALVGGCPEVPNFSPSRGR